MSASKLPFITICLATTLSGVAWAQSVPPKAAAPAPAPLDERITGQITPGSGLTADEAAGRALSASLALQAGRQDVAAARAQVDQAHAGYIPRLVASARYTRLSDIEQETLGNIVVTPPGTAAGPIADNVPLINAPLTFPSLLNQTVLQASLQIPISDDFLRVPQAVAAARAGERAAELGTRSTSLGVENDARTAYYNWVRARLSVPVAEQAVEQARAHLGDVRKAFDVGSASKADVLRVESLVAQAELAVVRAKNLANLAEARLRTVMRDGSGKPYAIGEDVLADLPAEEGKLDELSRQALEGRPELEQLDASAQALRGRGKVARAGYLPRLDLFADVQYADPNQRIFPQKDEFRASWDVGAVLTWTPTDIPATGAAVRESEARAASLEAQRQAVADGIRLEVLAALQAIDEARAAVSATAQTLVTTTEAYRVRRALFQNGRATSLELTDAELDLTRARFEAINARVDLRVARARLKRAVGGK